MNYEKRLNLKSWAEEDRPREKFIGKGKFSLSDAELIAILISSGNRNETAVELSKRILASVGNNLNELGKLGLEQLMRFNGVGEAKAISIAAALELGRRRKLSEITSKPIVQSSQDAFDQIADVLSDLHHEEFWVILLNAANQVVDKRNISKGGVNGTVADAKLIFKPAIEKLASSIVLCHNHPSGNINPSNADIYLTQKMVEAGKSLDISVVDHLIVGNNVYYSFADEGLM